jgi:hypothetical protein
MPTLTLKVSADFQRRLKRVARQRKLPVSDVIRTAVEKELPAEGRGFLLGRLAKYSLGPSTYDPAAPAFDESEWEHLREP